MNFGIMKSKIVELIENQTALQKHIKTSNELGIDSLVNKYSTAIFVECGEAIQETDFKWWKAVTIDINKLKEELADIFIFALDFSMLVNEKKEITDLLENTWVRVESNNEIEYTTMINRLKVIGSLKYASTFRKNYGLFVMRAVLDIVVLYGYMDFIGVVTSKQTKNIDRQENGYNRKTILI